MSSKILVGTTSCSQSLGRTDFTTIVCNIRHLMFEDLILSVISSLINVELLGYNLC